MSVCNPNIALKQPDNYNNTTSLCSDPYIGFADNIIDSAEASHIIDLSLGKIKRATVSNLTGGLVSEGRSGGNCWLPHDSDPLVMQVAKRIASHINMPLRNAESLQVIHYGPDQEYRTHFDAYDLATEKGQRCCVYGGQRIVTCLVYLNEVMSGGETVFPKAGDQDGISIAPKPGCMAIFHNGEQGTYKGHKKSLHAGMPVVSGEKWAFNIWFRSSPVTERQHFPSAQVKSTDNNTLEEIQLTPKQNNISGSQEARFGIGHFIPYFCLQNQDDKLREIQLYAGGSVIIFLLPPDQQMITRALDSRKKWRAVLKYSNTQCVFIINASIPACKELHAKTKSTISFWSDTDCAVSSFLGIDKSTNSRFLLTNQNLKTTLSIDTPDFEKAVEEAVGLLATISNTSNYTETDAPIIRISRALSPEICDRIINYWQDGQQYQGTVGVGAEKKINFQSKSRVDVNIVDQNLLETLDYELALSAYPELKKAGDFTVSHREKYKIGCYRAADKGHFRQHRDTSTLSLANRRYSMSLALSSNYEGGGLVFPEYTSHKYRLSKGDAILFPSTLLHKVEPVTSGERFVLVSFLYDEEGAKYRSHFRLNKRMRDDTESNRLLSHPDLSRIKLSRVHTQTLVESKVHHRYRKTDITPPVGFTPKDKIEFIEKAIEQRLFSKASNIASTITDHTEKNRISGVIKKAIKKDNIIHIQIAGDSLALPRPYYLKEFDANSNPFLSTTLYETYPLLLEEQIQAAFPDKRVRVDTSSCDRAFKSTSLTQRLPDIFSYCTPSAVVIQVGIVDCWRRGDNLDQQDVPIEVYAENISKILSFRKKSCCDGPLIFIGLCPTDPKLYSRNTGMNTIISDYNQTLRSILQKEEKTHYIDMEAILDPENPYDTLHLDGIHLSTGGHKQVAFELSKILERSLRQFD